jgi:hypothetical protein
MEPVDEMQLILSYESRIQELEARLAHQKSLCAQLQRALLEECDDREGNDDVSVAHSTRGEVRRQKRRVPTPLQLFINEHKDDKEIHATLRQMPAIDPDEPIPKYLLRSYLIALYKCQSRNKNQIK